MAGIASHWIRVGVVIPSRFRALHRWDLIPSPWKVECSTSRVSGNTATGANLECDLWLKPDLCGVALEQSHCELHHGKMTVLLPRILIGIEVSHLKRAIVVCMQHACLFKNFSTLSVEFMKWILSVYTSPTHIRLAAARSECASLCKGREPAVFFFISGGRGEIKKSTAGSRDYDRGWGIWGAVRYMSWNITRCGLIHIFFCLGWW